jgi:hypothetical protein
MHHLAVLIYGSPQIVLFAFDLDENLINQESVSEAPVLSF